MLRRFYICALCLLAVLTVGSSVATAAQKPDLVVRVVDVQDVMAKSKAMIGIRKKLSEYRKTYDLEFAKKEKALKEEERELVAQRNIVTDSVFKQKAKQLQMKFASFQKDFNKRQKQLQAAYASANTTVRRQMRKVWIDVANDEGATLILPRMQVLLFSPQYDVTEEVINRLNKAVPSVKFPDPLSFGKAVKGATTKPSK